MVTPFSSSSRVWQALDTFVSSRQSHASLATCIEHSDVSAMCKLCRDKDKLVIKVSDESAETQQMFSKSTPTITCLSESGLYRILAKCNLPKCEPFENWVFDEVLPSIRKTGKYETHPTVPSYMLASEEERAIAWAEEHRQARLMVNYSNLKHSADLAECLTNR